MVNGSIRKIQAYGIVIALACMYGRMHLENGLRLETVVIQVIG